MSRRMKLGVALVGVVFVGWLLYSSFQHDQVRYEVCINFRGRSHCATAAGSDAQEAIRSAHSVACTLITSGRDENILCLDTAPASVRPIPEGRP